MDSGARGIVSHVQRFSTEDGQGIRTTVFFQGCNLRCAWCHNPETWADTASVLYYEHLCTHCLRCAGACGNHAHGGGGHRYDRRRCRASGRCVEVCRSGALALSGRIMDLDVLADSLMEDLPFFQGSGGGITLSGGEPLLQADACAYLARRCAASGVTVLIDTAGCVPYAQFAKVIPHADHFFFDLKAATGEDCTRLTGGNLPLILDNLARLLQDGCKVTVRIPVIPGHNDTIEGIAGFSGILRRAGVRKADLIPFHRMGSGKYRALGMDYVYRDADPPSAETMRLLENHLSNALART